MVGFGKGLGCGCCDSGFNCPIPGVGNSHVEIFETNAFAPHATINLLESGSVSAGVFHANGNGSAQTYNSDNAGAPPNGVYAYPKVPNSKSGRIEFRLEVTAINELIPGTSLLNRGSFYMVGPNNIAPNFAPSFFSTTISRTNYAGNEDVHEVFGTRVRRAYGTGFAPDYDSVVFYDWTHLTGNTWRITFGDSLGSETIIAAGGTGTDEYCCGRSMKWNGFRSINAPVTKDVRVSNVVYTEL